MTTKEARDFATKINGPMTPEQASQFIGMLELGRSRITLERGETTVIGIVDHKHPLFPGHFGIEGLAALFRLDGEYAWTVRGVK